MQPELVQQIEARMARLGLASFSQYIQLVVRRDIERDGPIEIGLLRKPTIEAGPPSAAQPAVDLCADFSV